MNLPEISLRIATTGETTELLVLVAEFCEVDQHAFDAGRVCRALGPLLEHDRHGVVYLIEDNTTATLLGYAVLTWGYSLESGGREALIDEIYLRKRGEGLGAIVMTQIFDAMRERDISRMFLETETHNERARRFYSRQGFETDDSIWMSRDL